MFFIRDIGYELLRLAEPDLVPSVLVLESPKLMDTQVTVMGM